MSEATWHLKSSRLFVVHVIHVLLTRIKKRYFFGAQILLYTLLCKQHFRANMDVEMKQRRSKRKKLAQERMELIAHVMSHAEKRAREDNELEATDKPKRIVINDEVLLEAAGIGFMNESVNNNFKYTTILGTITTNKTHASLTEELNKIGMRLETFQERLLEFVTEFVLDTDNWIGKVLIEGKSYQLDFTDPEFTELLHQYITEVSLSPTDDVAWEIGPHFSRVHLHFTVHLSYNAGFRGFFHLDRDKLFRGIRGLRAFSGITWDGNRLPYINLRYIADPAAKIKAYMKKLGNKSLAERTLQRINEYKRKIADRQQQLHGNRDEDELLLES